MSNHTTFASGSTNRSIPPATVIPFVYSPDNAPETHPFGERQYTARDFAGHVWTFTQTVANVEPRAWGGEMVE